MFFLNFSVHKKWYKRKHNVNIRLGFLIAKSLRFIVPNVFAIIYDGLYKHFTLIHVLMVEWECHISPLKLSGVLNLLLQRFGGKIMLTKFQPFVMLKHLCVGDLWSVPVSYQFNESSCLIYKHLTPFFRSSGDACLDKPVGMLILRTCW